MKLNFEKILAALVCTAALLIIGCCGAKKVETSQPEVLKIAQPVVEELPPVSSEEADELKNKVLFFGAAADLEDTIVKLVSRYADGAQAAMLQIVLQQGLMSQLGHELGSAVDLSGPVVGGFWNYDGNTGGISVRLFEGREEGLKEAFDFEPMSKETNLLVPKEGVITGQVGEQFECAVYKDQETYLVCGFDEDNLPALGKVLVDRSMTTSKALLLEVDFGKETTRELLLDQFNDGDLEPPEKVVSDWYESVRSMAFDLSLQNNGLAIGMDAVHEPTDHPFVTAMSTSRDGQQMPPLFERLPQDAKIALAFRGWEDGLNDSLMEWFNSLSKEDPGDDPEQDKILLLLIEKILRENDSTLFATGIDLEAALNKLDKVLEKKKPKIKKAQDALTSWYAVGLESSLESSVEFAQQIVRMENKDTAKAKRKSRKKGGDKDGDDDPPESFTTFKMKKASKRDNLPGGTMYVKAISKPNPKYKPEEGEQPYLRKTTHVFLTTDGTRTWVVFSQDRKQALQTARTLVGETEQSTAANMLESFRPAGIESAFMTGFVSRAGFTYLIQDTDTLEDLKETRDELKKLLAQISSTSDVVPLLIADSVLDDGATKIRFRATISDGLIRSFLSTDNFSNLIKSAASK